LITAPLAAFFQPSYPSHPSLHAPALIFHITHPSGRTVLFDLGVNKDFEKWPPVVKAMASAPGWNINIEKDAAEILEGHGVDVKGGAIDSLIWSHFHFDHIGNASLFPSSTSITVGPGFKEAFLPAYPTNPESTLLESDFEGRELNEVSFGELEIGGFRAHDFFGDGSFYLLDCPGHTVGHLCGLARVTPDSFIFMGADTCHHGGEFRPTQYLPLPDKADLAPLHSHITNFCPGSVFKQVHYEKSSTKPFYNVSAAMSFDREAAEQSIRKMEMFDAREDVWVVIAHDSSLLEEGMGVDLFPKDINGWKEKGLREKTKWRFLKDFAPAGDAERTK
jgi:glyoxylase-like metal-dependent hydrolase (beta-lactamase superfamily II)